MKSFKKQFKISYKAHSYLNKIVNFTINYRICFYYGCMMAYIRLLTFYISDYFYILSSCLVYKKSKATVHIQIVIKYIIQKEKFYFLIYSKLFKKTHITHILK